MGQKTDVGFLVLCPMVKRSMGDVSAFQVHQTAGGVRFWISWNSVPVIPGAQPVQQLPFLVNGGPVQGGHFPGAQQAGVQDAAENAPASGDEDPE